MTLAEKVIGSTICDELLLKLLSVIHLLIEVLIAKDSMWMICREEKNINFACYVKPVFHQF
jgi:hypothetical protein